MRENQGKTGGILGKLLENPGKLKKKIREDQKKVLQTSGEIEGKPGRIRRKSGRTPANRLERTIKIRKVRDRLGEV